jgi:deazaflavin-dependent oxidoreductase (nitroreductase family)
MRDTLPAELVAKNLVAFWDAPSLGALTRFAGHRPALRTSVNDSDSERIIAEFRSRKGRVGGNLGGLRLLLLHHLGAKSGKERATPLAYWPAGDERIAILASNFGAQKNPAWYYNLIANPVTLAEIGARTWRVSARVASPEERRNLLPSIASETPSVLAAVSHSRREIPLIVLDLLG